MNNALSQAPAGCQFATVRRCLLAAGLLGITATATHAHSSPPIAAAHRNTSNAPEFAACDIQEDSAAILQRLKSEQRDLERVRRRNLPFGSGSSRGKCDERIGRFCYWYDDDETWTPTPENDRVVRRRDAFLASLDSASALIPGDPWVAAQRVRYLVEAGHPDRALEATENCSVHRWWCAALAAYIYHRTGDYAAADSTFLAALRLMPELQRCEWNDLSLLLEGRAKGRYRELACGERDEFERRFWWLADPFSGIPGNERRSEHFYRVVLNEMLQQSASPRRMRWRSDNTELLMRFGAPIGWERQRISGSLSVWDAPLIAHHRNGGRQFVPPSEFLERPTTISTENWELDPEHANSRFAIPEFADYAPVEYQLAAFKRGDSAVVVLSGGWKDPAGDLQQHNAVALALVTEESERPAVSIDRNGRPIHLRVSRDPMLASVEVWNKRDSVAGRERTWLDLLERLSDGFGVSDILLLTEPDSLPESLDRAIPLTRPTYDASPGERLGLFWEVYGIGDTPETVHFSLTVERLQKSFFRKAAEWVGIVGRREDTVRLRWSEQVTADGSVAAKAVGMRLNDSMRGEYSLILSAQRSTGDEARMLRRIVVR